MSTNQYTWEYSEMYYVHGTICFPGKQNVISLNLSGHSESNRDYLLPRQAYYHYTMPR